MMNYNNNSYETHSIDLNKAYQSILISLDKLEFIKPISTPRIAKYCINQLNEIFLVLNNEYPTDNELQIRAIFSLLQRHNEALQFDCPF